MKTFIIISALIGCAVAFGDLDFIEDTNGNYKLRFDTQEASRTEQRFADGKTLGSYHYVDPQGVNHEIRYVAAAEQGFNAQGADVPVSVPETAELVQNRAEHLAAFQKERSLFGDYIERPVSVHEVLSRLTVPEIASLPSSAVPAEGSDISQAKYEILAAYAKDLARLAEEYRNTGRF